MTVKQMVKFSQLSVHTEFLYAHFRYVKLTAHTALSLQGHGLLELHEDDEVTPLEDIDGKSETDIT